MRVCVDTPQGLPYCSTNRRDGIESLGLTGIALGFPLETRSVEYARRVRKLPNLFPNGPLGRAQAGGGPRPCVRVSRSGSECSSTSAAHVAPGRREAYPIGDERERARRAVSAAAEGARVALVSSGDAGIYGMASLAIDQAAALGEAAPELVVVPGVTAASAAGALLGAPLAVDFACLSLSAAVAKLYMLNGRRLERTDEPVRVRELRSRERVVLQRWLSA